jgi:hypothetical protein
VLAYYPLSFLIPGLSFTTVLIAVAASLGLVTLVGNIWTSHSDLHIRKYLLPLGFSAVLALLVSFIWQMHSPYPFNWDIYEHQTLVNTLLGGTFSFITSHVTDTFTFNGYSTNFHTVMAFSQLFFNPSVFEYWKYITYLHFTLVVLASYMLAQEITENKTVSVLSAIIGAIIFDSTVSFTSLFLIPQNFTAVIFIFAFIQLLAEIKHNRLPSYGYVITICLFLFINHYIVGTAAIGIYLLTYFYCKYHKWIKKNIDISVAVQIGIFVAFVAILFSSMISLGFLNNGEGEAFTSTLSQKFTTMKQSYGFFLILFLPLGISLILRRKREIELLALVLTIGILAVVLLQMPYVMKFYALGRFFVHLVLALGVFAIISNIHNKIVRFIAFGTLICGLLAIFILNSVYWKSFLYYDTLLTHVSPNEVKAADFMKNHYAGKDVLLVSDPATQHILEPLSGINSPGGAYMNASTRNELHLISQTNSSAEVAKRLYNINDSLVPTEGKRLFVVSGRYFQWQKSTRNEKFAIAYNIWYPADLSLDDYKKAHLEFDDTRHFTLVYQNPGVMIFEVNR